VNFVFMHIYVQQWANVMSGIYRTRTR